MRDKEKKEYDENFRLLEELMRKREERRKKYEDESRQHDEYMKRCEEERRQANELETLRDIARRGKKKRG